MTPLNIINAATATFECTFGRGCDGLCCKNGRPSVTPAEQKTIQKVMKRTLPHLRDDARKLIEKEGYLSKRTKLGQPMVRVIDEYCVFFNEGCVLHKIGAEDGKAYQYKPVQCALFPLEKDEATDEWFIRQWNMEGEQWDLFCLNPKNSKKKAVKTLAEEIELAASL
jgi:Fe-S-cluster containining protein